MGYNECAILMIQMPARMEVSTTNTWLSGNGKPSSQPASDFEVWSCPGILCRETANHDLAESLRIRDRCILITNIELTRRSFSFRKRIAMLDAGLRASVTRCHSVKMHGKATTSTGDISLGLPLGTEIAPHEVLDTLRHKWHVNGIDADLTPYISHPKEPKYYFRDESRIRYNRCFPPLRSEPTTTCCTVPN